MTVEKIAETSLAIAKDVADWSDEVAKANQNKPKYEGIAVMGSHPKTKFQAPFDKDWLIYVCSPHNLEPGYPRLPRWDQWFEIHLPAQHETRSLAYLEEVKKERLVWMRDEAAMPYFKGAQLYPEKELKERFGHFFFTSSIAFIMAKAIVDCEQMNIPRIGIFGVMQATKTEYAYQRPGIQYFIQRATELGIEVIAPRSSNLFEPPPEDF